MFKILTMLMLESCRRTVITDWQTGWLADDDTANAGVDLKGAQPVANSNLAFIWLRYDGVHLSSI